MRTGSKDLCKLGKEYLNAMTCKFFFYFFYTKFQNFWHITRFLPLNIAKLSTLTNSPGFLGPNQY